MTSGATATQYQRPSQQPEAGGEEEDADDDDDENDDSLIIAYLGLRLTTGDSCRTASQERKSLWRVSSC